MNEETQQKMFDPFFTSKEIGVGTGLGLSIAYKIIEAHNGRVEVLSLIHISEPTRQDTRSRMPSSA